MKIEIFSHNEKDSRQIQYPFFRFSTDGCGLPNCNCSPKRFLSFSTGPESKGIVVALTIEEANNFIEAVKNGWVDLELRE